MMSFTYEWFYYVCNSNVRGGWEFLPLSSCMVVGSIVTQMLGQVGKKGCPLVDNVSLYCDILGEDPIIGLQFCLFLVWSRIVPMLANYLVSVYLENSIAITLF